jgi:hypothetical protein
VVEGATIQLNSYIIRVLIEAHTVNRIPLVLQPRGTVNSVIILKMN